MIKKMNRIGLEGGIIGCSDPFHIDYDYTSFANIAVQSALHCFIFTKLNG